MDLLNFINLLIIDPVETINEELEKDPNNLKIYFPEVMKLKGCKQPKKYHAEGDVLIHTLLALKVLSSDNYIKEFDMIENDINVIFSVLLHDIGKPETTRDIINNKLKDLQEVNSHFREEYKTISYGHDKVGGEIAYNICIRIVEQLGVDWKERNNFNPNDISWLVSNHMLLCHCNEHPDRLKPKTIQKYFLDDIKRGEKLLKVIICDHLGSIMESIKSENKLDSYYKLKERINQIKEERDL